MRTLIKEDVLGAQFPFINNVTLREERGYANFPKNGEIVKVLELNGDNAKVSCQDPLMDFWINVKFLDIPDEYFEKVPGTPANDDEDDDE